MGKSILTSNQIVLLDEFAKEKSFYQHFYLSGGTALAEFYLKHRYSEDLDFFSFDEFEILPLQIFLRKIKDKIGIEKIDFESSFNRNLFFLHFADEVLKTEFTYYPFTIFEKAKIINGVKVDSLMDIAVNKTFTIYQKPRSRDFIDLYLIIQNKDWKFSDLIKKARLKFDTHIDSLQLAQQLLKCMTLKDYPKLIIKLEPKKWQKFWLNEAKKLKEDILT